MIRSLFFALLLAYAACYALPQAGAQSAAGISYVEIGAAGDSFTMGDGALGPNISQTISGNFHFSRFLITNSQFARFISDGGYNGRGYWTANGWAWKGKITQPAYWDDSNFNSPDQPVVGVSWYEALAYCNWLSLTEGLTPAYDGSGRANFASSGYRLPSEIEWEYAAAKGAPDQAERIYPWGDTWDPGNAVCRVAPARASKPASVGSKSPQGDTPQGLADMSGNVWQWCSDNAQSDDGIAASPRLDRYCFRSDSTTEYMAVRGGSWWNEFQKGFRSAFRGFFMQPGNRHKVIGFRIVHR